MLNSGMDQEHPMGVWGNGQPMHVYDKHQNKTAILHRNFSFAFDGFSLSVQGCLTERERRAFDTMYTDLPGVLTESIAELDSLLELRSRRCRRSREDRKAAPAVRKARSEREVVHRTR